jgi:hypothetical protein
MAYIQLDLFSIDEKPNEETIIKNEAMRYTALSIYHGSGHYPYIKAHLDNKDNKSAFKEFNEQFKNYGFANGKYYFREYGGKGLIKVNDCIEFNVTSKELFNILQGMYEMGNCK